MGMTNEQYKGMLLDELEDWQEVLELAMEEHNEKVIRTRILWRRPSSVHVRLLFRRIIPVLRRPEP